nr:MAG TPA: hypothetical protein [Caudoviricetes sp.]
MAKNIKRIKLPGVTDVYDVIDATAIHSEDVATSTKAGIVKIGSGITVAADGTISVNATAPVTSVNGKTGEVVLTAADVGALPSDTVIPSVPDNIVKYTAISNVEAPNPLDADSLQGHAADYFATAAGLASVSSNASAMQSDITTAKTDITNLKTDKMNVSGGTMTGALVAQNNTNYTTKQVRNVFISTSDPSGGESGDIWIKYAN